MADTASNWNLSEFDEWLDRWIALDDPDVELRSTVQAWLPTLVDDPTKNATAEPGIPNLWTAQIPGTWRNGTVVVCTFFMLSDKKVIRCNSLCALSWPV